MMIDTLFEGVALAILEGTDMLMGCGLHSCLSSSAPGFRYPGWTSACAAGVLSGAHSPCYKSVLQNGLSYLHRIHDAGFGRVW